VDSQRQQWLPEVKRVERVRKPRKQPQPRVSSYRAIKRFEILHRPFDLRFRGRLNKWLTRLLEIKGLKLGKILSPLEFKLVKYYLFPQPSRKKWLTQAQVARLIKLKSLYKIRGQIVQALLKIWENK
jgi:hypothetical protein